MPQNLIEKIAQKFAVGLKQGQCVQAGDAFFISPEHILTHDNTSAVMLKFKSMGISSMAKPTQPVFVIDHNVQDKSSANLEKYEAISAFAEEWGVDFYPAGRGIGHQVMCEEGYAWPGTMVVASDSHANMYGGLGALGTPVVRTDAAAVWVTGQTWWEIPPVARVELKGALQSGVTGKDVIIALTGFFNNDEVLNHAVEFAGEGVASLSMDQRFTIANMTTEWGALAGVFPIDMATFDWLEARAVTLEKRGLAGVSSDAQSKRGFSPYLNFGRISELKHSAPYPDPDAFYAKEIVLDLSTLVPLVAGPDHVKSMTSVTALEAQNIQINKAYLLSCVNSRVEDLTQAAQVIKGKKVAETVDLYIAAASDEVQLESERRGDWQTLLDAGAKELPPGCGPCIGLGDGLLGANEVGISATNRNFKGRMGDASARTYLASPAVVAASAIAGKITSPITSIDKQVHASISSHGKTIISGVADLIEGFPSSIEGRLVFCHQDNLNTDGIYPGKYTYMDDISTERMAAVVMENYDPKFSSTVKTGDILVGGFNFGTGSSREQAATALLYSGIQLVLAGSFSATYKRNAINNGLLVLEVPELVNDLVETHGREDLTVATENNVVLDLQHGISIYNGKSYDLLPPSIHIQELIRVKGLENWVKERLT